MPASQPPPKPVFQTDPENVAHVAQVAAHQVEAAVGVVTPADGHLPNAIAQTARDRQNFHVEHISVDLLPAKQLLGRGALEKLKPALRVVYSTKSAHGLREPNKPAPPCA